jgi:SPP1 gp7 family putative phage head morphogenesis protein
VEVTTVDRITEALGTNERDRRLRPIERRLSRAMGDAFKRQSNTFLRELRKLRDAFPAPLQESVPENIWVTAWLDTVRLTQQAMTSPIEAAARASWIVGNEDIQREAGLRIAFDIDNPEAVQFLRDYGAQRVTMINDTTRDYIRTLMVEGMEQGTSYTEMARQLRARFAEFSAPKPQRHLRNRAELVAVTETANAYGTAQRQAAERIQREGIRMQHRWITTGDDRVSDGCRQNAAAGWIPMAQAFPSGDYHEPRFPGCRCAVQHRRARDE